MTKAEVACRVCGAWIDFEFHNVVRMHKDSGDKLFVVDQQVLPCRNCFTANRVDLRMELEVRPVEIMVEGTISGRIAPKEG